MTCGIFCSSSWADFFAALQFGDDGGTFDLPDQPMVVAGEWPATVSTVHHQEERVGGVEQVVSDVG